MKTTVWMTLLTFVGSLVAAMPAFAVEPKVDWGEEYIKARGLGSFQGEPSSRKLIIAREKAKLRAERDILGIIEEMAIDSNTTIKETMDSEEYSEFVSRNIKGTLRGARVLSEGQLNRNTYEVIVGVKISDVRKAVLAPKDPDKPLSDENPIVIPSRNFLGMGAPGITTPQYMEPALPRPLTPAVPGETMAPVAPVAPVAPTQGTITTMVTGEAPATAIRNVDDYKNVAPDLAPIDEAYAYDGGGAAVEPVVVEPVAPVTPKAPVVDDTPAPAPAAGAITGVIVDGRRFDADRAFWPRVLGPGNEVVYGNYDASVDFLQDQGAVEYATTLEEARSCSRAGANPLIVKASDVFGTYKADLVLDAAAAAQVRAAEASWGVLRQYRVIFLLHE